MPKHEAAMNGYERSRTRNPMYRPLNDNKMVPATMTSVPPTMGRVTRSPRSRMASPLATSGVILLTAEATGAPTFWMAKTRKSRPPVVPIRPERAKYGTACHVNSSIGTSHAAADHAATAPTTTLIQAPA